MVQYLKGALATNLCQPRTEPNFRLNLGCEKTCRFVLHSEKNNRYNGALIQIVIQTWVSLLMNRG